MTNKEMFRSMERTFRECLGIVHKKNADYAKAEDAFLNFRFSTLLGIDPAKAILIRVTDKLARISNLLDKGGQGAVADEKITDTIRDGINYLAILLAMLEDTE